MTNSMAEWIASMGAWTLVLRGRGARGGLFLAAAVLLICLAGCRPSTASLAGTATPSPPAPTVSPAPTRAVPATEAAPPAAQPSVAPPPNWELPRDGYWRQEAEGRYRVSGYEDTFAWSSRPVEGDLTFSAEIESDWDNYGEAMVVVYGDGQGWSEGCLIFSITGYWQSIRAHSIYDPEVGWLAEREEPLDLGDGPHRMTVQVVGDEARLYLDEELLLSAPLCPDCNRQGYVGIVKYGGSAPAVYDDITLTVASEGAVAALVPADLPTTTRTPPPTATPMPRPSATPTCTPTPAATPTPTQTPLPTDTPPPTNTPPPPFRPATGLLEDRSPGGQGELLIKNGTDADALAVLAGLDDVAAKSAYIRNGESFRMTGIADGVYRLYFSRGEAFSEATYRFTRNATYQRLDATLEFTTTATQYTGYEVTLYGVAGGNVGSETVDPAQFP